MSLIDLSKSLAKFEMPYGSQYDTKRPNFADRSEITVTKEHANYLADLQQAAQQQYIREELMAIKGTLLYNVYGTDEEREAMQSFSSGAETDERERQSYPVGESLIRTKYRYIAQPCYQPRQHVYTWRDTLSRELTPQDYYQETYRVFGITYTIEEKDMRYTDIPVDLERLIERSISLIDENRQLFATYRQATCCEAALPESE